MATYWKVDNQKTLRLIMCSHASFRSDVTICRAYSPTLKVPHEAPYDHLKKAPTSLDATLPRCQLCGRTCGKVHAAPVKLPPVSSKNTLVLPSVKEEASESSVPFNPQVFQVDSDNFESEIGAAPDQAPCSAGHGTVAHNKRAKVQHSEAAAPRASFSASSDVTGAYFLTYRMLCKFPESQVVSFFRRMRQLERGGHFCREATKYVQDMQDVSSDDEVLCNVPESHEDETSGEKSTWLHHDVRTILENGASKATTRQHAIQKSYIEPKLVPIPTIIKHLEPHLSIAAFNKVMDTDAFNNKRVQICRVCHARYSTFVLSSRIERIHELVEPLKAVKDALKLPITKIGSQISAPSLSARSHAPPKTSTRPMLTQRKSSATQSSIHARECNGQMVRGVRLMLHELQVPVSESSGASSDRCSDEDSEGFMTAEDNQLKPLHRALSSVHRLFESISGAEWPQFIDNHPDSTSEFKGADQSLTFAKWMNFCKNFSATVRLPIQKQDCIDCFKDANSGSLQHSMSIDDFSTCLLLMAVKCGILSLADCCPPKPERESDAAAESKNFSLKISSAIELIKTERDGRTVSSALASLFPSQHLSETLPNSARSALPTQRAAVHSIVVRKRVEPVSSHDPVALPTVQITQKKDKFNVETKSALRDKLYSGKAHLRRLRYNSAVGCPTVVRGIVQLLRSLHIVIMDVSSPSNNSNVYESPPLWHTIPLFCKLFHQASMASQNMISNMGTRQKTLNLGEWSVWCSEQKVCDFLSMRKSDVISCFLMAGGNVTGCEVDLEGFCSCFIQMALLAGFLRADQLIDNVNPLVELDVNRTNAQFGIDISPCHDQDHFDVGNQPTSNALWERLPIIQAWFKHAAAEGGVSFGNRGNLVSLQEWQNFCRRIGFASLGLSRSDLTYAFVNGFSQDNSDNGVRQDIYEARIAEFSQSIIVIALRAHVIQPPLGTVPSASNCDEDTLVCIQQMFARLSVPVAGNGGLSLAVRESAGSQLPKRSVFATHFKQLLVRTFDTRDQCTLDEHTFSLPDILPCLAQMFSDISQQMTPDSFGDAAPAVGFESTLFWIKFCIHVHAVERLHLRLADAVTCVLAADPEASHYRRAAPMTLELFSQCLLHLAQRSKFLLREDADSLPRAMQCRGCAVLAVAFMLIALKQAPEMLSQDVYLRILAANSASERLPRGASDHLPIAAPSSTQEALDRLLKQQSSKLEWPATDQRELSVALQKMEASLQCSFGVCAHPSSIIQDHQERANLLAEIGWACSMTGDRRSAMQSVPRCLFRCS